MTPSIQDQADVSGPASPQPSPFKRPEEQQQQQRPPAGLTTVSTLRQEPFLFQERAPPSLLQQQQVAPAHLQEITGSLLQEHCHTEAVSVARQTLR